ncbi:MAG: pseudaminic acid synthase [Desulfobacteraceae bacterium]|nr:pseudaminic acid synthase [Desulfobacteraceae bacterium]
MGGAIKIGEKLVGKGHPVYIVAEISANHNQDISQAIRLVEAAKESGADAVKLQTYTPDTLTIDCNNEFFLIRGNIWAGKTLYDLYREAYTPWEWHPRLKNVAEGLGMGFFSTPFDGTAVDFLEQLGVPVYKVASFELIDIPLLRAVAATGKPVIMSTGMATLAEIDEAVRTLLDGGSRAVALLKCTSAYPAVADDMNLMTIANLADTFGLPVGLSDHSLEIAVPVAAVTLGAVIVEKHITLSRARGGPDSAFSLEPHEFKAMVDSVRVAERAVGHVSYSVTEGERSSRVFRRSLFVVEDVSAGEFFSEKNVRSIRPGFGLHPRNIYDVIGRRAARDINRGTPLSWDLVA